MNDNRNKGDRRNNRGGQAFLVISTKPFTPFPWFTDFHQTKVINGAVGSCVCIGQVVIVQFGREKVISRFQNPGFNNLEHW